MYTQNRGELRRTYLEAWRRAQDGAPLEPLERLIVGVIEMHPEYHGALNRPEAILDRDFSPDSGQANPFLHMGMHIAILEQVGADRPAGIAAHYHQLVAMLGDTHEAEHRMMELLGGMLWEAQRIGQPPDERQYLQRIASLAGSIRPSSSP